ncbi:MAG TPA: Rossmann-like and DUF2520 domain-containing protein [Syntrophorhabdaceae bacterium]|nr:Rossmann-like and DUF2520 domain-containing protein [Syntrophorhabdaceae bacterium]
MRIGIIGAGKVGTALACVLKRKGFVVTSVSDADGASLRRAEKYLDEDVLYTNDNMAVLASSEVIAVTTQDRIIQEIAKEIYTKADRLDGKLFFHTSGADPSSILIPLTEKGALVGSLHPLQTFPDVDSAIAVLPDTCIFIEGNEKAIPLLRQLGESIGARVYTIAGEHKVLYHLSAVFVCNLLSALMYAGKGLMDRINIDFEPFIPIIEATIKNIEKKGPLAALTGPVVRGDIKTVKAHLASIEDMELHTKVYKALSEVAVKMAEERKAIDETTVKTLKEVLR